MQTNRRGFLSLLASGLAGAVLDPDRLLWVPGKKLISIPKPKFESGLIYNDLTGEQIRLILNQRLLNGGAYAHGWSGFNLTRPQVQIRVQVREFSLDEWVLL